MASLEGNEEATLSRFETEFRLLPADVQSRMLLLLNGMFGWGNPRRWVKKAKTEWRGSRIQLDSALPVLQILSPSIKVEETVGLSTVYAPDTFYVVWDTDEFIEPELSKLNEIISPCTDGIRRC
jgi:hypothetical protein